MAKLKDLKEKIVGTKKTADFTKAMQVLSTIKMKKAQSQAINSRYYALFILSILKRLSKIIDTTIDEVFAKSVSPTGKNIILLISPDKGLTGSMNILLFKEAEKIIKKNRLNSEETSFVCIGKKGYKYIKRKDYYVQKYFDFITNKTTAKDVKEISLYLENLYREGGIKQITIVFTQFLSITEQKPTQRVIFPLVHKELEYCVKKIFPEIDKNIDINLTDIETYLFAPNQEDVVGSLLPFAFYVFIYYTFLESLASKHAARMVAMKNATDRANEIVKELKRDYNKERQSKVTQEIIEIVSGVESMK